VREDGGDLEAARALDVHEKRVGGLYETLELVLTSLELGRRVEKIVGERHDEREKRERKESRGIDAREKRETKNTRGSVLC